MIGIERDRDGVTVATRRPGPERFDQVVLACHADQALRLLADPTPLEREVLGAFPYAANDVVLHSEPALHAAPPRAPGPAGTTTGCADGRRPRWP